MTNHRFWYPLMRFVHLYSHPCLETYKIIKKFKMNYHTCIRLFDVPKIRNGGGCGKREWWLILKWCDCVRTSHHQVLWETHLHCDFILRYFYNFFFPWAFPPPGWWCVWRPQKPHLDWCVLFGPSIKDCMQICGHLGVYKHECRSFIYTLGVQIITLLLRASICSPASYFL